ncbi:MAG: efflux RND transporter permease subunit [Polyangiaceae bacterium]
MSLEAEERERASGWERFIGFFVDYKLVVVILTGMLILGGLMTAPFRWDLGSLPRDPTPVDAIPDIGENQQIVFTEWPGRSPRDVEDQIGYPLTTALLGISGVRTVRSFSMFGFSSIYVIFEEGIEFYWSRSRILEKLASLPAGTLPDGVAPALGPDATALGQVFWYTLEGRDPEGKTTSGWDEHELRSVQDWTVRYALQSVPGVSEVASVGGHVREYQVDIDPEALLAFGVGIDEVARAVKNANLDVGARTMEINRAEYVIRGLGFIRNPVDLEQVVVKNREHTPIRVRDVAKVGFGPAPRRGALDIAGAPAVGGVVVSRFGANPMQVIEAVKAKIAEIGPSLPRRKLEDGTLSQVTIVPFYDRTVLIEETLSTLSTALWQQILITVVVVLVMLRRASSSLLVTSVLPLGVLGAFVAMRYTGVDANIMALSGIAIAIGTMVDMGIVFTEAIVTRLDAAPPGETRAESVKRAAGEVAPAVLTSTATTVLGFLPVFALTASEGKLFRPLAFTKTFAMVSALAVAMLVLPALAHLVVRRVDLRLPGPLGKWGGSALEAVLVVVVVVLLAADWLPLGRSRGLLPNLLFVAVLVAVILGALALFLRWYERMLRWSLEHKGSVVGAAVLLVVLGVTAWGGFDTVFGWVPKSIRTTRPVARLAHSFEGLGREYMPPFDEGAFLYMPTTMPHASVGQAQEQLATMDAAIRSIPEVETVVGKLGRVDSPLDPAPVSMFETVIMYKPEFGVDAEGRTVRNWRDHIHDRHDIWREIKRVAKLPGVTDAPELMPIAARIVMLQSGMRAPMGLKIRGPDLATIERAGLAIERALKEVPAIRADTVVADRIVGKPYLEIDLDREAIARHGLSILEVQDVIQIAIGGRTLTQTVEGRERYPVRVRYMRERRDSPDDLGRVLVPSPLGHQLPLEQLAHLRYARGPQVIKSEDTFATGYVVFDKVAEVAEVDAVEQAKAYLETKIARGELELPEGVSYTFAGSYENQLRSERRLAVLVPLALSLIILLIYLQFRRLSTTLIIFSGAFLAVSGGFLLIWLYGKAWFLDLGAFGVELRDVFRVGPTNMSVAVWVGFIALVGIATDDGVVMATYLHQLFDDATPPKTIGEVRARVIEAGCRRSRACIMTTATTILALLPVVTATGRGADVMLPMALPALGGMTVEFFSLFLVPVLFSLVQERRTRQTPEPVPIPDPAPT